MEKKKRKKKIKKKVFVFLFLVVLIFVSLYFLYNKIDTKIKNIYIYDNSILSDQEIIELGKIQNYPDFFTTLSRNIEKDIETSQYIKTVDVQKKFYKEIHIYIKEYKPLFIEKRTNTLVLGYNNQIEYDNKFFDIPTLLNYVPKEEYKKFIEEYEKLDANVISKISEIKYDPNDYDENRFLFYMNDGNYVYILTTKLDVINKYNTLITKLEGKKGILYLDSGNYFKILE
jgi:cell division septal protein FtsQ